MYSPILTLTVIMIENEDMGKAWKPLSQDTVIAITLNAPDIESYFQALGSSAMQRKKSLPDVATLPTVTVKQGSQAMTRWTWSSWSISVPQWTDLHYLVRRLPDQYFSINPKVNMVVMINEGDFCESPASIVWFALLVRLPDLSLLV